MGTIICKINWTNSCWAFPLPCHQYFERCWFKDRQTFNTSVSICYSKLWEISTHNGKTTGNIVLLHQNLYTFVRNWRRNFKYILQTLWSWACQLVVGSTENQSTMYEVLLENINFALWRNESDGKLNSSKSWKFKDASLVRIANLRVISQIRLQCFIQ